MPVCSQKFCSQFSCRLTPPPNQQSDGFPLEFLLERPQTKLRALSQNCEQTLQKLRTNRIMNKRVFLRKVAWQRSVASWKDLQINFANPADCPYARSWQALSRGPSGDRIARSCRHMDPDLTLRIGVKDRIAICFGLLEPFQTMIECPEIKQKQPQDRKPFLRHYRFLSQRSCRLSQDRRQLSLRHESETLLTLQVSKTLHNTARLSTTMHVPQLHSRNVRAATLQKCGSEFFLRFSLPKIS